MKQDNQIATIDIQKLCQLAGFDQTGTLENEGPNILKVSKHRWWHWWSKASEAPILLYLDVTTNQGGHFLAVWDHCVV
jgi:hypothetical protein